MRPLASLRLPGRKTLRQNLILLISIVCLARSNPLHVNNIMAGRRCRHRHCIGRGQAYRAHAAILAQPAFGNPLPIQPLEYNPVYRSHSHWQYIAHLQGNNRR